MNTTGANALSTSHIHGEEIPWAEMVLGLDNRVLHAVSKDNLIVAQIKAEPGMRGRLHRHLARVFGFTPVGFWGHDREYDDRPGTYASETPGVIHRFSRGANTTEAVFINLREIEMLHHGANEVTAHVTAAALLSSYEASEQPFPTCSFEEVGSR